MPSTLEIGRAEIEEMIRAGLPMADVEPALDAAALDQDERDALWLMAWSRPWNVRPDGRRRRVPLPAQVP